MLLITNLDLRMHDTFVSSWVSLHIIFNKTILPMYLYQHCIEHTSTWKPNIAWSQSKRSSSTFLLYPFGQGRPLVLRSAATEALICHQESVTELDKYECSELLNTLEGNLVHLRVSHDCLIHTFRVKWKNIIRHVDLGLFFDHSVLFQDLYKYEKIIKW